MKTSKLINVLASNLTRLMASNHSLDTFEKVAKRSGIGKGTVERIKKAQVSTTIDKIEALAETFGVSPAAMVSTFTEAMADVGSAKAGYVRLPLVDAPHGLGGELSPVDNPEILQYVEVNEDWVRRSLHANFANIKVVPGIGDSMKGMIEDGSIVFVDVSVRHYDGDGLYAIVWKGRLQIKRLQARHEENKLKILSDNKHYEPDWATDDLVISGKVLAAWNFTRF